MTQSSLLRCARYKHIHFLNIYIYKIHKIDTDATLYIYFVLKLSFSQQNRMWKTQAVVKVSPQDIGHVMYTIRLLNFKFQFLKQMVQRVPTITYCYFSTIFFFFCHIYYTSVDEPWCICLSDYRCNGNIVIVTIDNSVLEWKKKTKKNPADFVHLLRSPLLP